MFGAKNWMLAIPLLLISCGGGAPISDPAEVGERIAAMVETTNPGELQPRTDWMSMHNGAQLLVEVGGGQNNLVCLPFRELLAQPHPDLGPYVIPGEDAIQKDMQRTQSFVRMLVDCRTNQTARIRCQLDALEAVADWIGGYPDTSGPLSITIAR